MKTRKPGRQVVFLVNYRKKRGLIVKGKTRIEIEGEILAYVEKEMQKPRLTESVRNGLSAQAAQAAKNATRTRPRSTTLKRRQAGNSVA
jgi:hypothetical protein